MAVDIVLTHNGKPPLYRAETSIRFAEHDDDFWQLQTFFERLHDQTSERIDLYDGCLFEGETLIKLKQALTREINDQRLHDEGENREAVLTKLEKWLMMTDLAIGQGEKIVGIGD